MTQPNGQYKEGHCPFHDSPELRALRNSIDTLTATIQGEFHGLLTTATGKNHVPLKTHYWTIASIIIGFLGIETIKYIFKVI